ncbi:YppF family protein [Niallia sp. XMNu-256]|uniref:YppF family protein n=1 Tax=Niallia sp. XMNu-256 TaxID=3082444 RepID=UPI0030D24E54
MLLEDLTRRFNLVKNYDPLHVNELLDFVQRRYVSGEISIAEYKKLFFELDQLKAEKPHSYFINTIPFSKVNLPG